MDIGAIQPISAIDGVQHALRLLRGGGVVQIDQRLAIDLLLQAGELGADGGEVKHGTAF